MSCASGFVPKLLAVASQILRRIAWLNSRSRHFKPAFSEAFEDNPKLPNLLSAFRPERFPQSREV